MMPPPARQLIFGDEYMPKFNWRSSEGAYYDQVEKAEMTGIAWECLRRNASFEQEYQAISSQSRTADDGFRQHWGLVFRGRPGSILPRTDDLLGSRGRADNCAGPPGNAGGLADARQVGPQRTERKSVSARSGRLACCVISAWRRASHLVQRSANRRRRLHRRIPVRPGLRIQDGGRSALVARA
jgi:hypothetical protein